MLDANPASMPGTLPNNAVGSIVHASMIMLRNQRADATDDLVGRHPILHLPQVTPTTQSSFDFQNSADLIESGYAGTSEFLRQLPDLADTSSRGHGMPTNTVSTPTPPPRAVDASPEDATPQPPGSRVKL